MAVDWPVPLLQAERQAGDSQSWKARGNLGPRDCILHQIVIRLPVANQVFLGSWMADIHQEGCSPEISSPEETHSTPEMVLSRHTQETVQLGPGR